jgi:epoxyqueuosine reductase
MIGQLQAWAAQRGWRLACGSARLLDEARAELERQRGTGELNASFYAGNLNFFRYESSSDRIANVRCCAGACPTGAIGEERVLLHAESCTTLFSEQPGDLNHHLSADCLFGCLECQQVCPANWSLLRVEAAGVTFNRRETQAILGDGRAGDNTTSVTRKLARLGLTEEALIGRNLAHLIARRVQERWSDSGKK